MKTLLLICTFIFLNTALAADTMQINQAREQFANAFNERNWEAVTGMVADDAVFHRMNADTMQTGPGEIVDHFSQTIGGEWNVKFVRLENMDSMAGTGDNTNTVDAGHFAVTAGGADDACYAGFYLITWNKDTKIQVMTWQDAQVDISTCKP